MKKYFINFLFFFLFLFLLFVLKAQSKLFIRDFDSGGDYSSECDYFGTENPCGSQIEYGCPDENYFGGESIPEENILYGSSPKQRSVTFTCTETSSLCLEGSKDYGLWGPTSLNCNNNEYCDQNNENDFFCHTADNCIYSGSFPEEPLSPKNGESNVLIPITLDWCDVPNYLSYKIRIYELGEDENDNPIDVLKDEYQTNSSSYCLGDLDKNENYKWSISYCSQLESVDCSSFQSKWSFSTGEKRDVDPPGDINPRANRKVDVPFDLSWDAEVGAGSYYIEIYNRNGFDDEEQPIFFDTVTSTTIENFYLKPYESYEWRVASCENSNGTACGDVCCDNMSGSECADFSTIKDFRTDEITYPKVFLSSPVSATTTTMVRPDNYLTWQVSPGEVEYLCEIIKDDEIVASERILGVSLRDFGDELSDEEKIIIARGPSLLLESVWPYLENDTMYEWNVSPCSEESLDKGDCQSSASSDFWEFKTSGGNTEVIYPSPQDAVGNPVSFQWENVPEAFSYSYRLEYPSRRTNLSGTTINSYISIDYPESILTPKTPPTYWFEVKACAGDKGIFCEDDWHRVNFSFDDFEEPSNPSPENNGNLFTSQYYVSWEPNPIAKAYKYTVQYVGIGENEQDETCLKMLDINEDESPIIYLNEISTSNSVPLNKINCLGDYQWFVASCFNADCTGPITDNSSWNFKYVQSKDSQGGLLPCNRSSDNLDTPWNERESCNFKHIPIFFYNVTDFLLWEASFIALLLLVIFSAIASYAAAGLPVKIISLKNIWGAAGKGYAVMFLAWTIINLLLKLLNITDVWLILPF